METDGLTNMCMIEKGIENNYFGGVIMFERIGEVVRTKCVGIDIFDNPLKAVEIKKGIYINESLENFYNLLDEKRKDLELQDMIINSKYWENDKVVKAMFKYARKGLGSTLGQVDLYVALPHQYSTNIYNDTWKEKFLNSITASKWRSIHLISNYLCAAIDSGVLINDKNQESIYEKCIFVYSTKWNTYVGLVFAGGDFNVEIINAGYDDIKLDQINNSIINILDKLSNTLPEMFLNNRIPKGELEVLHRSWAVPVQNKIYMTVPNKLRQVLGEELGSYQLIYSQDYNMCILNGLSKIMGQWWREKGIIL